MGNMLPFHCQCEPHLWLQDLPPTAGALSDPSERPLWTEEKKTEGKTQFRQEGGAGGDGNLPVSPPGDPGAWKGTACGLWAYTWECAILSPTDVTVKALKMHPLHQAIFQPHDTMLWSVDPYLLCFSTEPNKEI